MASHEEWKQAQRARDRCAVACARALLAGRRDEASRHAAEFAMADAEMGRLERILEQDAE